MISKSYKDRRNFSTASYIEKKCGRKNPINPERVVKNPRQTKTIRRLTDFFVAEYQLRGVAGLPVNMEEVDPSYTDDEYEARVIAQYCNKPEYYKDLLSEEPQPKEVRYSTKTSQEKSKKFSPSESSSQESPEYQDETSGSEEEESSEDEQLDVKQELQEEI